MRIALHAMPGNEATADRLAQALAAAGHAAHSCTCGIHRFPDGESLVTVDAGQANAETEAVVVCTLDKPDAKTVPLLQASATLRELGARRVGLLAPYLPYMRQDARFAPGQAISARVYARLLSDHFDWLLTVDPHLHRIRNLGEVYAIPAQALSAAPLLAEWIGRNVDAPLIIGPDEESAQWAESVAQRANAPVLVLRKTRLGDQAVRVHLPDLAAWPNHTPVLVDDIISTGRTLLSAVEQLRRAGTPAPVCVAVHGLCAGNALPSLLAAGATRVVCTNSIAHGGTPIDLTSLMADGVQSMLAPT